MEHFFQQLTEFLEHEIAPIANRLDEEDILYGETYPSFVALGSLNLLTPQALGGLGGERKEWIEYNILMAQYSGALLFLQAQHQFCISRLKQLLPNSKVEAVLSLLVRQRSGLGLALAKRSGLLVVESVEGGYRLSGKLPWVTGLGYFSDLLISFEDEGQLFYALLPFQDSVGQGGAVKISSKIETSVFNAVPSHSVMLDRWFLATDELLASHPIVAKSVVEHPSAYNLAGASKALLHLVTTSRYNQTPEVVREHTQLQQRWDVYYRHLLEGSENSSMSPFALRAEGIKLAEQSVFLARVACGSAGILKSHPLSRLIREVWQYTVAGYSEDQLKAYLCPFC